MLKNYLKTAFRHLTRHKSHFLINVIGLGLGLGLSIVAYLNWKFDADFDKFHSKRHLLHQVVTTKASTSDIYAVAPAPIKELAKTSIAGVQDALMIDIWGLTVNVGTTTFSEDFLFTEDNFLDWFDFTLSKGEAHLDDPASVLITERSANKYFGDQDPIGKTISIYSDLARQRDLVVTGVLENPAMNSSIFFDFITNSDNQQFANGDRPEDSDWTRWRDAIFLAIPEMQNVDEVEAQLGQYVSVHRSALPDFGTASFSLVPFSDLAHYANDNLRHTRFRESLPAFSIWGNVVMAILLLLTACINFTNSSIALAGKRLKEIGVRKVLGGYQRQLVAQLLLENFIVCALALGLGIFVATHLAGWYNQMFPFIDLEVHVAGNPELVLFLTGSVIITTLMAGAYPAFYISAFNPNRILNGSVKFGGSNLVSRILLGFQMTISLVTVAVGLSFARNAHFQQTADLGFQREGIQAVRTGDAQTFHALNNAVKADSKIESTAGVRDHIGDSCPRYEFDLNGEKHEAEYMEVGPGYLDLMDIRTVAGRAFNDNLETDYERAIMLNEKFARDFFPNTDPVGQRVTFFDTLDCTVIGVVGNFMQDNFFDPLRPLVLKFSKPDRYDYLAIRSKAEDLHAVHATLASAWKANFPNKPFEHGYQDDFLAMAMLLTTSIQKTMLGIAIVTLIMTVTGLFALISLTILKRMKEIAVRRILGASIRNVSFIVNKNYVLIILVGTLVGCAAGAWLSAKFLDSIYKIHAGVAASVMIISGAIALTLAVITISTKIYRVMQMNPADVLNKD